MPPLASADLTQHGVPVNESGRARGSVGLDGSRMLADDDIWHAARRGDAEAIERFIQRDVNVSAADECGRTAGYYAGLYGHTALAGLLRDFEAREAATRQGQRAACGDRSVQPAQGGSSVRTFTHEAQAARVRSERGGVLSSASGQLPRTPQRVPRVAIRVKHAMSREAAAAEGVIGAREARVVDPAESVSQQQSARSSGRLPRKFRRRPASPSTASTRSRNSNAPARSAGREALSQAGAGVVRNPHSMPAALRRRRAKLNDMRSSRERLRRKRLNDMVRRQQLEDLEVQKDAWMTRHGMKTGFEFTREQKRELKRWFNFLDADGSGEINIEELEDPLLSTGAHTPDLLARSHHMPPSA